VTLLLPNRDNGPVLDMVLMRLAENTSYPNYEVVAVDDESTDGSREILCRWQQSGALADFRLIEHPHTDAGVVDALNAGLAAATGEFVVQLDADASIETPGWLERMVDFMLCDPQVAVVTAKVVTDGGQVQACGINVVGPQGFHDRGTEILEPAGRRTSHQRVRRFTEREGPDCDQVAEVDGGIGVCMIYRRAAALAVGGYDRGFAPVWFDDLDLTLALRRQGGKVFYLPDVRVVHHLDRRGRGPVDPRVWGRFKTQMGRALPAWARTPVVHALNLDRGPEWYQRRLRHHYDYWAQKWGWDLLNPDMNELQQRWGGTEICWRSDPEKVEAGQRIMAAYDTRVRGSRTGPR
jgi:GT2 family glycosyltransferase